MERLSGKSNGEILPYFKLFNQPQLDVFLLLSVSGQYFGPIETRHLDLSIMKSKVESLKVFSFLCVAPTFVSASIVA